MKFKTVAFIQIVLLLLMVFVPSVAMANISPTLSLNKTSVSVGTIVTASGKTAPEAWVPLKVVDSAGNIVVFDAVKADEIGNYSINFIVPTGASGKLTVVVGEGSQVATGDLNVSSGTGGGGGGGGGGVSTPEPVESTTGTAKVNPNAGGTIGLGDEAIIEIPADAIPGTSAVEVKVEKVSVPSEVPVGLKVMGNVYELSVGGKKNYSFDRKVTITFRFDPNALSPGEIPFIHYYDEELGQWVNLGGKVSGNTISVEIDHFTKFAVMAVKKSDEQEQTLNDIIGHWAEDSIKELVSLGAITGYPDQTFKPNNDITRAEFATVLVKAFMLESKTGKVFNDTASHWAKDAIATAAAHGIVNGYSDTTFGPNDNITREQMAVMIARAANLTIGEQGLTFSDCSKISGWAEDAVAAVANAEIIKGYPDGSFQPQGRATRAEAVTMIVRALK
jgi:hypothetical protein